MPIAAPRGALASDPFADGLPRLDHAVRLDGVVDSDEWGDVPILPVVQQWPAFGTDRTGRTRIRVAHDGHNLWIAGEFLDAPGDVRAQSLQRDRWNGDDALDVLVDGSNDDATGLFFSVTPLGVRLDTEVRNDAGTTAGIQALNPEWNAHWDARSVRTDQGWSTEMRIPLDVLGVQPRDGRVTVGLLVSRLLARTPERDVYPAVPPDWPRAHLKPSKARDVELDGVEVRRPFYVTPYVLTGLDRTRDPSVQAPVAPTTETPFQAGGDVRIGLGPGVTLDLTANMDFAQAESDELQVNLGQYNLFYPEKRQFFQERSATFESSMGSEIRLFHSRTIGLADDGSPRRVLGGARVAGVAGPWDFGALSLQVQGSPEVLGENDAVARVRRALPDGRSSVGGLVTARLLERGDADATVGVDGLVSLGGDDWLTVQGAWVSEPAAADTAVDDRTAIRIAWERRRTAGLGWAVEAVRAGNGFQPAMGFLAREAFTSLVSLVSYDWLGEGRVSRVRGMLRTQGYWRTGDGSLEAALQRFRTQVTFRNGLFWNLAVNLFVEDLARPLELPGATVPAGRYRAVDVYTNVFLNEAQRWSGEAVLFGGRVFDGWRTELTLSPKLNLPPHVSLGPQLSLNRLFFPTRHQTVVADALGLRATLALDTRWSLDGVVQYNRAVERVVGNARLRVHLGEGRDVYLVYDGVRDLGSLAADEVGLGRSDARLLVKATWSIGR